MIKISIELFFRYCPLFLEKIHYHCRGIELSMELFQNCQEAPPDETNRPRFKKV